MAKFKFQLEAVLRQRTAVERTKQLVVAGLEHERRTAEEEILACQRSIDREKGEMRDMLRVGGVVDLRGVRMQAGSSLAMTGAASRAVFRLGGVQKRLELARAELLRATTARKAVETLRERRYEAWLDEQKRREDAALDEMAVIRGGARDESEEARGGEGARRAA